MGFEENVLELHVAEELLDISENPVVKILWDLGKSYLPVFSVAEGTINSILEKRVDDKLTILLQGIVDTKELITKEQLENIDTINAFILMLDAVNKTNTNDKIIMYSKLYVNTWIGKEDSNFDEYQEWLYSLSDLSYREIFILLRLYKYEKVYQSDKSWGAISTYWDEFIKEIRGQFNLSNEDIYSLLERLLRTGFYYNNSDTIGAMEEKYKKGHTTSYFETFAQKINNI